jgi:hypothetical protein
MTCEGRWTRVNALKVVEAKGGECEEKEVVDYRRRMVLLRSLRGVRGNQRNVTFILHLPPTVQHPKFLFYAQVMV